MKPQSQEPSKSSKRLDLVTKWRSRKMWEAADYQEPSHLGKIAPGPEGEDQECEAAVCLETNGEFSVVADHAANLWVFGAGKNMMMSINDIFSEEEGLKISEVKLSSAKIGNFVAIVMNKRQLLLFQIESSANLTLKAVPIEGPADQIFWAGKNLLVKKENVLRLFDVLSGKFSDLEWDLPATEKNLLLSANNTINSFCYIEKNELFFADCEKERTVKTTIDFSVKSLCMLNSNLVVLLSSEDCLFAYKLAKDSISELVEFSVKTTFSLPFDLKCATFVCSVDGSIIGIFYPEIGSILFLKIFPYYFTNTDVQEDEDNLQPPFFKKWISVKFANSNFQAAAIFTLLEEKTKNHESKTEVCSIFCIEPNLKISHYLIPVALMLRSENEVVESSESSNEEQISGEELSTPKNSEQLEKSEKEEQEENEKEPEDVPENDERNFPKGSSEEPQTEQNKEIVEKNKEKSEDESEKSDQEILDSSTAIIKDFALKEQTKPKIVTISELEENLKKNSKRLSPKNPNPPIELQQDQFTVQRPIKGSVELTRQMKEEQTIQFTEALKRFQDKVIKKVTSGFEETRKKLVKDLEGQIQLHFKIQEPQLVQKFSKNLNEVFTPYVSKCLDSLFTKFAGSMEQTFSILCAQMYYEVDPCKNFQIKFNEMFRIYLKAFNFQTQALFQLLKDEQLWALLNPEAFGTSSRSQKNSELTELLNEQTKILQLLNVFSQKISILEKARNKRNSATVAVPMPVYYPVYMPVPTPPQYYIDNNVQKKPQEKVDDGAMPGTVRFPSFGVSGFDPTPKRL